MRISIFTCIICLYTICLPPTISNVMGSFPVQQLPKQPKAEAPDITIIRGRVKLGSSISEILDPVLPLKTVYQLNRQSRNIFFLQNIRPGKSYEIHVRSGRMIRFEYMISPEEQLIIQKKGDGFSITRESVAFLVVHKTLSGHISSSLFDAVRSAGEGCALAGKLSDIFAWDIDFIQDIRPGDHFRVIVEKRFHQDRFLGYGKVLAAAFTCRGTTYQAYFHRAADNTSGYYDEKGRSLQKAFLKAPLAFSRISSRFALKRMHPILKEFRSHPAVDYAAAEGTPVKTVGDGIIAAMGFSRTMGNHVMIRHANGYVTRYFHLSGFAKGLSRRDRVVQGELIGYVGHTGYATGPHLCFRMTKDGRPVDPLAHKTPSAVPVAEKEMPAFLDQTARLSLELSDAPSLAMGTIP